MERDTKILKHLEHYIGAKAVLRKTIKERKNGLGFDLVFFRANHARPYHIVSTIGLSDYKMKGKSKRVEFIFYLDKRWDLFSNDEEYNWIYKLIGEIAFAFKNSKRAISSGQCFYTEGSNTFSKYTEMSSAIFYYPLGLDNDSWSLKLSMFSKIDFYLLTTSTYKEYPIVKKMGGGNFIEEYLLEDGDLENLVIFNTKKSKHLDN